MGKSEWKPNDILVFHIREHKSPYMDELRGFRLLLAVPNLAGHKFNGQRTVSFNKPYLVFESLDLLHEEVVAFFEREVRPRFKCQFVPVEFVEALEHAAQRQHVNHKSPCMDDES